MFLGNRSLLKPSRSQRPGSLIFSLLVLFVLPGAGCCWAAQTAPIVTTLDIVTTPTRGGECQVLWMGTPALTPDSADLTFYLKQPGSNYETSSSQPITLSRNGVGQRAWSFATPASGAYHVSTVIRLKTAGGVFSKEDALDMTVPQAGKAALAKPAPAATAAFAAELSKIVTPQAVRAAVDTGAFTVSGTFLYTNRLYSITGVTSTQTAPVRYANVEILERDSATTKTLGWTATDNNGYFMYRVPDNIDENGNGRDLSIRLWLDGAAGKIVGLNGLTYISTVKITDNWPGGYMDLKTMTYSESSSAVFNIFDVMMQGYDFVKSWYGYTIPKVTWQWASGSTAVTAYNRTASQINVHGAADDPDEFDDDVLLYMYGHFILDKLACDKGTGGSHNWTTHTSRPTAWSEGWAGFFARVVRGTKYYVDISSHGVSYTDAELPTGNVTGDDCEGAVTAFLWDIYDSTDEGQDHIHLGFSPIWYVATHYFNSLKECSIRDFLDGWIAAGYVYDTSMQSLGFEHGVTYRAPVVNIGGGNSTQIIPTAGESIWLYFAATVEAYYSLSTQVVTLPGDIIYLYGPNSASTLIAQVSSSGGVAQLLRYLTPGTYYIKIVSSTSTGTGSVSLNVTSGPSVTSFAINNGAASTTSRAVTLNLACAGSTPAYYIASETSNFSDAVWIKYTTAPLFTLTSAGNGTKTIYVKVKDAAGVQSSVKSDAITLNEAITINALGINTSGRSGNISPAGDADWYSFTVTVGKKYFIQTWPGTLFDNVVTLYGPNSQTTLLATDNDSGLGLAGEIIMTLAPGTYYAKVQANNPLDTGTYTINILCDPMILALMLNNGAVATPSRTITLNNVCTGKPTYYMASESASFTGAVWIPYSVAPSFSITSTGSGTKTIYFKVRDASGVVSQSTSRQIFLQ